MRNHVAFSIEISKNTQTPKRTLQQFYFTGKWCKEQITFFVTMRNHGAFSIEIS